MRHKARLVVQGFLQKPKTDYEFTYSLVVDAITFCYLISFVVHEKIDIHLMDIVTAYLYGSLDNDVNMKISKGFKMPEAYNSKSWELYSIKLQRSLYGLKQSEQMWYNLPSVYLLKEGYKNEHICPCVFIKKANSRFTIIVIYIDVGIAPYGYCYSLFIWLNLIIMSI